MRSSEQSPDVLRSAIRNGTVVEPGDTVSVITVDGREHAFKVSALDDETVRGESSGHGPQVAVAIDDVIALRTRPARTTLAATHVAYAVGLLGFLVVLF